MVEQVSEERTGMERDLGADSRSCGVVEDKAVVGKADGGSAGPVVGVLAVQISTHTRHDAYLEAVDGDPAVCP